MQSWYFESFHCLIVPKILITFSGLTMQLYSWVNFARVFFRAFGDKSGPPPLPDAESEGQGVNGEEYEVDDMEEEEAEKCVEEEQSPCQTVTDQACSGIEELSLTEQEEEKGDKGNEEEEGNQDDQKMPQGTRLSHASHHFC